MSIKEEVTQSRKISNMIAPYSDVLNDSSMVTLFNRIEYLVEDTRTKTIEETKQKMIEGLKEMIDKKLEGFKKVKQGIIGNTKVLTAYNCFIAHLEELKSQVEKT